MDLSHAKKKRTGKYQRLPPYYGILREHRQPTLLIGTRGPNNDDDDITEGLVKCIYTLTLHSIILVFSIEAYITLSINCQNKIQLI
jgi:hypothetical protein